MLHSIIHFFFVLLYICLYSNKKIPSLLLWSIFSYFFIQSKEKKNQLKQKQHYGKKKRQKKDFAAYYNENK